MPGSLTFHLHFRTIRIGRCAILLRENTSLFSFVLPVLRFLVFFQCRWQALVFWQPLVQNDCQGGGRCERFSQPSDATVFLAASLMLTMISGILIKIVVCLCELYLAHSVLNTRLPWSFYLCNSFFSAKKKKTDLSLTETSWINKAELNNQQWVLWWKCLLFFSFLSSGGWWKNHTLRFSPF